MLAGWLGPIVVLAATGLALLGLCVLERWETRRLLPPACRRRARGGPVRFRALAPREFPKWSEKAARLFLAGGSCKWR